MSEDKNLDESLNEDDVIDKIPIQFKEKKNSIIGVYSLEKGKETTIFNPEKIDLSEKNYTIEILLNNESDKYNISTNRILEDINYKFVPELNGIFEK